jgi:FkbM family methyltransferase
MKSWRLTWALAELSDTSNFAKHSQALHSSWKFWLALVLKLIPGVWPFTIQLRLKQGGVVAVKEFMTLYIYKEIFVDGCYDLSLASGPAPFIIDVGANTGLFIIRMKQLYPNSRVAGYEPLPSNFLQLKRSIELSRLDHVDIFMQGVGGTPRIEKLYIHPKNIGGHSIFQSRAESSKYVEVNLIDVQGLLPFTSGTKCNLLKLDCEGAEFEIITSIREDMAARIENILFEATPSLYDVNQLVKHLEHIGYRVTRYKGLYLAVRQGDNQTDQAP